MRQLIAYNYQFSPGDNNHVYVENTAEAEMHIDYTIEDYIDHHIKGPGYVLAESNIIYAYSPEIPGVCVVYLIYKQSKSSTYPRLLHVGYVYKEDAPYFNLPMLRRTIDDEHLFIPAFRKAAGDFTDQLYTLHGKQQSTELPWE